MKIYSGNLRSYHPYLFIFCFAIISFLLILSNPGYFNHDELQKLDHIKKFGILDYFNNYVKIYSADAFGTPVRPLSFAVQGMQALFLEKYPIIVHLSSVVMHAIVACLIYTVLKKLSFSKNVSFLASLIFVINPTSIIAVGWSSALMDRLYVLFGLLTLIFAIDYILNKKSNFYLVLIFITSFLSILSKETAITLPGLMIIFLIKDMQLIKSKRFLYSLIAWCLPIVVFMIIRLPAIVHSFKNPSVKAYSASFTNVYDGILVYFSYPFLTNLKEAGNWILINKDYLMIAIVLHCVILLLIYINSSFKYVISYLYLYFVTLTPVLFIPIKGTHYMYGAGIILSLAIAGFFTKNNKYIRVSRVFSLLILTVFLIHNFNIQNFVYQLGGCMNKMMVTSESAYKSLGEPSKIVFQAQPGAQEHILYRLFTGRNRIGDSFLEKLTITPYHESIPTDSFLITVNKECEAIPSVNSFNNTKNE